MKNKSLLIIVFALFATYSFAEEAVVERQLKNESELGYVMTGGNTEVTTLTAKQLSTYSYGSNMLAFNARYLSSANKGAEQALQWGLGLKYERLLTEKFGFFIGPLVESNLYQGIFQRYATDVGAKQYIHKKDKEIIWFFEGGYRYTRENYLATFKNINFMRLYTELENYWSASVSLKFWFEYLPNITTWKAYQMNTSIALNTALSSLFSLKTGYELRHNNEPPAGKTYNDSIFTTSIIAKF